MDKKDAAPAKKGQAAIEYLMTYGWAILVIAIVIVALYVMTQTQVRTELCNIQPGFVCNDPLPQIYSSAGSTYANFQLHNKMGQAIIVSAVHCTMDSPNEVNEAYATALSPNITIASGTSSKFTSVACERSNTNVKLASGQDFKGYVLIWYNFENDINTSIRKIAVASISTTIQKAS